MPCTWSENGEIAVIQSKQTWCSSLLFRSYFFFQKHHTLSTAARLNFKREARQGLPGQQKGRPPSKTKSRLVLRMFDLVITSDRLSLSMPRDSQASQANVGRG